MPHHVPRAIHLPRFVEFSAAVGSEPIANKASILRRTSSLILINGGHGLLNPSPASLRVASIPSFVPIAISEVA